VTLLADSSTEPRWRVLPLNDCGHTPSIWDVDWAAPPAIGWVSSAKDSEKAKQTSGKGANRGISTFHFCKFDPAQPKLPPNELASQVAQYLTPFSHLSLASATPESLFEEPIVFSICRMWRPLRAVADWDLK
jgi:hypothetical protein